MTMPEDPRGLGEENNLNCMALPPLEKGGAFLGTLNK